MEICRNIKIRILAFMMAFWLAFSVSYNDYQDVKALEWAIPVIGFDTAIKFLLGLLGVSLTSKALHDNVDWNQVQQDCVDFQIQKGNDAVAVGEWWEDVAKGTLNQASSCWTAFKEWVKEMLSTEDSLVVSNEYKQAIQSICNINFSNTAFPGSTGFTSAIAYVNTSTNYVYFYFFNEERCSLSFKDNYTLSVTRLADGVLGYRVPNSGSYPLESSATYGISAQALDAYSSVGSVSNYGFSATGFEYYFYNIDFPSVAGFHNWVFNPSDVPVNDGIFDSANENIEDTAITTDTPTTTAIPDTLPLPWDNVSDTAEGVDDAISALQEQVAEGVISLEDYWERVQELINAMAIDTTTDEVLPTTQNPSTGENETIQDKVEENISNVGFTLSGLEKVFPFCIPWDIYSFVTLLVAEPQAPVFQFPIYNPANDTTQYITVDLSAWESVAVLVRYIFDFLLIIGLLLLARSLIGAEG